MHSHPLPVEVLNRSSGGSLDVTAGPLGYVNPSIDTPGAMPTRLPTFSRRCEVVVCIFVLCNCMRKNVRKMGCNAFYRTF